MSSTEPLETPRRRRPNPNPKTAYSLLGRFTRNPAPLRASAAKTAITGFTSSSMVPSLHLVRPVLRPGHQALGLEAL